MGTRDKNGRFSKGWKGGPGRPSRATEATYLIAISEQVTLDVWQSIVSRAVEDAQQGDSAARLWLTRYLIGDDPPSLLSLAAAEQAGVTIENQIEADAGRMALQANMTKFRSGLHTLLMSHRTSADQNHE